MARDKRNHGAVVEIVDGEGAVLLTVTGVIDEQFAGFGSVDASKSIVIDVTNMARMTSFGIRQWLRAVDALPSSAGRYLLGCPTFFVDQLNMVLNFGGACVVTVQAPYRCPACAIASSETVDVLAHRAMLAAGGVPEKTCATCNSVLEFDETPESYFSFVSRYAAKNIDPRTAELLAARGLYRTPASSSVKPPRIIKLVADPVTYFRIIGTVGQTFRARPLLVGAEGEVVIDFVEVDRFERAGLTEWRRLLRSLANQVQAITLVDVDEEVVEVAGAEIAATPKLAVWSVRARYRCRDCGRRSRESQPLAPARWPNTVCPACRGAMLPETDPAVFAALQGLPACPPASMDLIKRRDEMLARALDAHVANLDDIDRPVIAVARPRRRSSVRRTVLAVALPPIGEEPAAVDRTPSDGMHVIDGVIETHGGDLLHRDQARVAVLFGEGLDAAACALELRALVPAAGIALASGPLTPATIATRAFQLLDEADEAIRIDDETAALVDRMFRVDVTTDGRRALAAYLDDGPTTPPARPATVIGHYRIVRPIEKGGMGVVYLAEHVSLGRRAVIKLVQEQLLSKELAERFHREARALASIPRHPNIVEVLDYGYDDIGRGYLVMEFLEGETLRTRLVREGRLAIEPVLALGSQVASALAAAHAVGVVHRDLKPDNIFLVDGGTCAKVLDFGVARILGSTESRLTNIGNPLGTVHYISPEQWHSDDGLDHRADVYSLGCVMFELVTGKPPFDGTVPQLFISHTERTPPSPRGLNAAVPVALEHAILRMLAKAPAERQANMGEVIAELGRIAAA